MEQLTHNPEITKEELLEKGRRLARMVKRFTEMSFQRKLVARFQEEEDDRRLFEEEDAI